MGQYNNHITPLRAALFTSALGLSSIFSSNAWGQDLNTGTAQPDIGAEIGDIIVTARKRDERISDVPVSVSAFGQERLEAADITSPVELSDYVPGLDFQQAASGTDGGGSNPNITFRGIRQQLNTASNQVGAIFWDGSFMGSGAGILPVEDIERIEVTKGPQTAYFGRNTFAGAVNYISKEPDDTFAVNGELLYSPSDRDSYKIATAVSIPFADWGGLRLSWVHSRKGGDFSFGDGSPLNQQDKSAFSGVLKLHPSERLNIKFSGYYADAQDTFVNVSIPATVAAGQCDRVFTGEYINTGSGVRTPFTRDLSTLPYAEFCGLFPRGTDTNIITPQAGVPTAANSEGGDTRASFKGNALLARYGFIPSMPSGFGGRHRTWRAQMNGDYTFAGEHTFSWIASRSKFGSSYSFDQNFGLGSSGLLLPRGFQTYMKENYLEGRVSSPQDQRFRYMAGITYYDLTYRNGGTGGVLNVNFEDSQSLSFFGAIDFDVTDKFTISAEGRYTNDKAFVLLNGNPTLPIDNPTVTYRQGNSFSKFMPRLIFNYKLADRTTIYASWSRSALIGEQTNAAVVSGLDPAVIPDPDLLGDFTPPQQNTAYEIGWKQQFDKVSFTLALFHMRWKNQIFRTTVLAGTQTTTLATPGESEYWGVEFEGFAKPARWLDLGFGLLYVDPKLVTYASRSSFESFVLGSGNLSIVSDGKSPTSVSKWSGNFNATVRGSVLGIEAYIRGDALYRGKFWVDNLEFNRVKAATRFNLRGGIDLSDSLTLEVYGKNLTDSRQLDPISFTTFGVGSNRKIFTPPPTARELGVRLMFDF